MSSSDAFENRRDKCLKEGVRYTDTSFPATRFSIRRDGDVDSRIVWKRPHELVSNPCFITEGATRFDLTQGDVGNCWFIAGAACVAMYPPLFERCVPQDQGFTNGQYAGIFHFHFFRFGSWEEVIIDDRLPTLYGRLLYAHNRTQTGEFWAALLEKAYAKLHGSYFALDGGFTHDAIVDLTGGLSEWVDLRPKPPANLYDLMLRTTRMNSMIGCSIDEGGREEEVGRGLYAGHAYSVTAVQTVNTTRGQFQLLRLRNPWGKGEWTGPWSDGSREWDDVSASEKALYDFTNLEDGEFWMAYTDWIQTFQTVNFCHLSPDAVTSEIKKNEIKNQWETQEFHAEWIRGYTAGGCGNPPNRDAFWLNPQFSVRVSADADLSGRCTLVVSLMQDPDKVQERHSVGFFLYKVGPDLGGRPLTPSNYNKYATLVYAPTTISNLREVSRHFELEPGTYVIIPCTFDVGKEARFYLRTFTEKEADVSPIDPPTEIVKPSVLEEGLESVFRRHTGGDVHMDAEELKEALNELMADELTEPFGSESAVCMLAMHDRDGSGELSLLEFKKMMKELDVWKRAFVQFDTDRSGSIDTIELTALFSTIGFRLSRDVMARVVRRFGGKRRRLDLKRFLHCCAKIMVMYGKFAQFSSEGIRGEAKLTLEQWMGATVAV